jgi:hypothetical protein
MNIAIPTGIKTEDQGEEFFMTPIPAADLPLINLQTAREGMRRWTARLAAVTAEVEAATARGEMPSGHLVSLIDRYATLMAEDAAKIAHYTALVTLDA